MDVSGIGNPDYGALALADVNEPQHGGARSSLAPALSLANPSSSLKLGHARLEDVLRQILVGGELAEALIDIARVDGDGHPVHLGGIEGDIFE